MTARITGASRKSTNVWFVGPLGLWIDEAQALPEPIPCSGALGFFQWQPRRTSALVEPLKWMRAYGREASEPTNGPQGVLL